MFRCSVKKFIETYKQKGITSVAFPQLGTDAGGLKWSDVRLIMYNYLSNLENIDVEIYSYDEDASDKLFLKLYDMLINKEHIYLREELKLNKKQFNILYESVVNRKVSRMNEIENLKGLGEKTIANVYRYAMEQCSWKKVVKKERQLKLPLGNQDELI
ncbi:MAG: hypothetical protein U5L00_05195 [Desulfovermiculus sp.]|nr:hypothetical protein [Desulfovermiculus sp.]